MSKPVIDQIVEAKVRFHERTGIAPRSVYIGTQDRRELNEWLRRDGYVWRSPSRQEILGLAIYTVDAPAHIKVSL